MKKILIILGLILASLLTIGGCKVETSTETSFGLTIEGSDFVNIVPEPDGGIRLVPRGNSIFEKGEKVNFVLLNVGKFKRGDDGLNWFDIDMEIKDANGNILSSQQGLMGEGGHADLPDDTAATPYSYFTAKMEPGNYKVTLTVHDKVGGGSASKSKSFTVEGTAISTEPTELDLKNFPKPFVVNGVYDSSNAFVFGDCGAEEYAAGMNVIDKMFLEESTTSTAGKVSQVISSDVLAEPEKRYEHNLIFVGGPGCNLLVEDVFGIGREDWWREFEEGEGLIMLIKNGENKAALLVAGSTSDATMVIAEMLADYGNYDLTGTKFLIKNIK